MTSELFLQLLDDVVFCVLSDNSETVEEWLDNLPRSWGKLAGLAIILSKDRIGRTLIDSERRMVWNHLWINLQKLKLDRKINI
jgi:hypothetical protein